MSNSLVNALINALYIKFRDNIIWILLFRIISMEITRAVILKLKLFVELLGTSFFICR